MTSISAWDDEYARISRAASQLRTSSTHQPHPSARQHQIRSVRTGLSRLKSSITSMSNSGLLNSSDVQRRLGLIKNLEQQVGLPNGGGSGMNNVSPDADLLGLEPSRATDAVGGNMSMASLAMRHQDDMIDELATGVSRLRDQTMMINEEAGMQNRILEGMDGDVERATQGLEAETMRALKLKEDQSVWRLYLIIAGLSILLFLLIMSGLG